ncbi:MULTISPECIES: hypothetical protein [unclassified Coleofasciculus]|uniref:hypothetical protein n=1 Tax=unclassified Coleofasciculus TaxID=2692782 RepID=UPI001881A0A7|nr:MULTISPECIES: hypothetical protein [unclassified Coleofasciculus]MBE9129200.1 hypothetical protein [Coleofasciculus sp. LEGE 07081]MBE9151859.1 hypothetical protein [Coleofasciculus sp. LEGE 07092]
MSLFLSLSKAISSHPLLGLPDPRAIAFGDSEDCDRVLSFPQIHHVTRNRESKVIVSQVRSPSLTQRDRPTKRTDNQHHNRHLIRLTKYAEYLTQLKRCQK